MVNLKGRDLKWATEEESKKKKKILNLCKTCFKKHHCDLNKKCI